MSTCVKASKPGTEALPPAVPRLEPWLDPCPAAAIMGHPGPMYLRQHPSTWGPWPGPGAGGLGVPAWWAVCFLAESHALRVGMRGSSSGREQRVDVGGQPPLPLPGPAMGSGDRYSFLWTHYKSTPSFPQAPQEAGGTDRRAGDRQREELWAARMCVHSLIRVCVPLVPRVCWGHGRETLCPCEVTLSQQAPEEAGDRSPFQGQLRRLPPSSELLQTDTKCSPGRGGPAPLLRYSPVLGQT